MDEPPGGRCGYTWPDWPDWPDWDDAENPNEHDVSRANSCYRETYEDCDRCLWHGGPSPDENEITDKQATALREALGVGSGDHEDEDEDRGSDRDGDSYSSATGVLVDGAVLQGVQLGTALSLERVSLRTADLRGVDLQGATLRGADLNQANLQDATLTDADLRGADLSNADLFGPDLRYADLTGAAVPKIEDDTFGIFELDPVGAFVTETTWNETTVELFLSALADEEVESALDVARSLWADQSTWADRLEQAVTEWAIDFDWIDEVDRIDGEAAFVRSLTLTTVSVTPDGRFGFWHDDGLLESGHGVHAGGTLADGLTYVKIEG